MSRILCTFPGKFGDLLWALPTVRAIAEAAEAKVDLLVAPPYRGICPLIQAQSYLDACWDAADWQVQQTAPMTPWAPTTVPEGYDRVVHLGYRGWPDRELAEYTYASGRQYYPDLPLAPLDLRPWITAYRTDASHPRVIVGWSEEHFELKIGLLLLLAARFQSAPVEFWWLRPWGRRYDAIDVRWQFEDSFQPMGVFGPHGTIIRCDWSSAAGLMATGTVFLGCLSALWVLANALGLPTVICEPNPQRHHPIFWREHPKNLLVRGGDGQPTFDARHVGDALNQVLAGVPR